MNWHKNNPEASKASRRKHRLKKNGWTPELYDAVELAQNKHCAICGELCSTGRKLAGDHDHATGKPRGLLCQKHNVMIGQAGDDPKILDAAAAYLRKYGRK